MVVWEGGIAVERPGHKEIVPLEHSFEAGTCSTFKSDFMIEAIWYHFVIGRVVYCQCWGCKPTRRGNAEPYAR